MPALDYSKLAAVYDDYCDFDRDIDFFRSLLLDRPGRTLELMAGTGRLSVPLVESGADLTCLDSSAAMLAVLRRKLHERRRRAALVCADVCALPFRARFDTVLLPFNGICELTTAEEQRLAMHGIARVLPRPGRFVCTAHNPRIRRQTLDGKWHDYGDLPRKGGGVARVALKGRLDTATGIVEGWQKIELEEESGRTGEILIPLRFSLISPSELLALAEESGLRAVSVFGDYDGSEFDETASPSLVLTFERTG